MKNKGTVYKDLQPGVVATIYDNYVTEEKVEGDATLIKRIGRDSYGVVNGHPVERWNVRFLDDGFVGSRFIVNHFKTV